MKRAAWLVAGAAPALWGVYTWGSHLLTAGSIWRGAPDRRAVALTFDDGPDPAWTPAVLDALRRGGVRATFFLIGQRAAAASDLVRRAVAEGHELGNHTWSHRPLWLAGPGATRDEIERGHEAVA
ncbi:MAG TPA: polysaccharide deacetylase family protein, partial [Methylomirabilota bacterium]